MNEKGDERMFSIIFLAAVLSIQFQGRLDPLPLHLTPASYRCPHLPEKVDSPCLSLGSVYAPKMQVFL